MFSVYFDLFSRFVLSLNSPVSKETASLCCVHPVLLSLDLYDDDDDVIVVSQYW